MQEDSRTDIGRFLDLDRKRNGAELILTSRTENGIVSLRTSRIPWIQCFERGNLKNKRKENLSIHFCFDDETADVVLRTNIPVIQLSIYGAAADVCDELAWRISDISESIREPVAKNN